MHTLVMIMAHNSPYTNTSAAVSSPAVTGDETTASQAFLEFINDWFDEDDITPSDVVSSFFADYNPHNYTPTNGIFIDSGKTTNNSLLCEEPVSHRNMNRSGGERKREMREKVAFRTKTEIEVLDDGFKWRKYGKKMVKNSRNPRNYYKCSVEGCLVKKRVERDNEDRRYVITTYDGIHNHEGPRI